MSKELTSISNFYKSFSGTDTLVFILMPGSNPVVLGSLTTISYSAYRNKKPVLNLGRTNINGVTRGSRVYAGTMIFTLINQHWLNELKEQDQLDWLNEYDEIKADELPLFDLMVVSANEYGSYVSMFIYGVDLTDEAQVISIEDLFTENTFSFVARDISSFKAGYAFSKSSSKRGKSNKSASLSSRLFILPSSGATAEDIERIEAAIVATTIKNALDIAKESKIAKLTRDLFLNTARLIIGSDVAALQALLNAAGANLEVTGVFDKETETAVKSFQSYAGLSITGVVNQRTYNALLNGVEDGENSIGIIINKSGAYTYQYANMNSDIVDTKTYKEQVKIIDLVFKQTNPNEVDGGSAAPNVDEYNQLFYKTENGYILADDVFSYKYCNNATEFPTIKVGDTSVYVTMLQSSLSSVYGTFKHNNGEYDLETEKKVKQLQTENGLDPSGVVDNNTWLVLQNLTGDIINGYQDSDFKISFSNAPGEYTIKNVDLSNSLMQGFDVDIMSSKTINVKCSAICYYGDKTKIITKMHQVKDDQTIDFQEFQNAFVYDIANRSIPDKIEYIVYPFGKEAYKWTINYTA